MVGFSFLFGGVVAGLIETVRKFLPRKATMACWFVIASILALGLQTIASQYRRYVKYVEERPGHRHYDEVRAIFKN
jgi:hypothetical protein